MKHKEKLAKAYLYLINRNGYFKVTKHVHNKKVGTLLGPHLKELWSFIK